MSAEPAVLDASDDPLCSTFERTRGDTFYVGSFTLDRGHEHY